MNRYGYFFAPLLLIAGPLNSCSPAGTSAANSAQAPRAVEKMTLPRTVITPTEGTTVDELFDRGKRRFEKRQYALAAVDLETAAGAAPEQPWAPLAFYEAAIARDETGNFPACAENFKKVVQSQLDAPQQRDAQVRLVRVLVHLERWSEAGLQADSLLSRYKDLRPLEIVVARGARALAQIKEGNFAPAERDVEFARGIIEDQQFQISVRLHRDVAVVYFALGELRRHRAEAIRFVPLPANFSEQLEQRCQLLLDAQSAYSTSMRAYDAHWSVMAGYRVGELYARLHADLMEVLVAISFDDPARKRLFDAALRLRYSVLLSKAVTLMEHTLAVAVRTDEDSHWVQLARESCQRLKESLAQERTALDLVPYSREQLQAALENLKQDHGSGVNSQASHDHLR